MILAIGFVLMGVVGGVWPVAAPLPAEVGQLAVFVQPDASEVARSFARDHLPGIERVAEALGVPLRVIDVSDGVPREVTITPLIVYQNFRGRSIFQGRFANVDRIRNFIRTARAVPQREVSNERRGVFVYRAGRATVVAPIKIADVTGSRPAEYSSDRFLQRAEKSVARALKKFKHESSVSLGRGDRVFYMDFYPWRSDDGQLFVSVAMFSQFHCKKPIFTRMKKPFEGRWAERDRVFGEAAIALESAALAELGNPARGDGFDPVSKEVREVSWESLGLAIPDRPAMGSVLTVSAPLGRKWVVEDSVDGVPRVQFRFPAPLDGYSGEARSIRGRLELSEGLRLDGARGSFQVRTESVTMGDPDLDEAIQSGVFLNVDRFPKSTFVIERVTGADGAIRFGRPVNADLHGTFTMKGMSIPLTAASVFEAVVDGQGRSRLVMHASFEISLKPFDMEGPDGPSPQKETLVFDVNLMLGLE